MHNLSAFLEPSRPLKLTLMDVWITKVVHVVYNVLTSISMSFIMIIVFKDNVKGSIIVMKGE